MCDHHVIQTEKDIKSIKIILFIIAFFMMLEIWGHLKTNSLSLLADALHLLVDISGFLISIFTLHLSQKSATTKHTFGYQRYEIIGAMGSVFLIWVAAIYLMLESIHKFIHPHEINTQIFTGIAIVGLFVNVFCCILLHSSNDFSFKDTGYHYIINRIKRSVKMISNLVFSSNYKIDESDKETNQTLIFNPLIDTDQNYYKSANTIQLKKLKTGKEKKQHKRMMKKSRKKKLEEDLSTFNESTIVSNLPKNQNLNIRATYVHIIGDIIQSIGVVLASLIIHFNPKWVFVDLICTLIFTFLVVYSTIPVFKDGISVLSEATPAYIDIEKIKENIEMHPKILEVLNIKCWSVGMNCVALNLTILVDFITIQQYERLLKCLNNYLRYNVGIEMITIEINTPNINK
ncbi:hypothetical protein NUSPORA_00954 [Nucleospora cyclopteri]